MRGIKNNDNVSVRQVKNFNFNKKSSDRFSKGLIIGIVAMFFIAGISGGIATITLDGTTDTIYLDSDKFYVDANGDIGIHCQPDSGVELQIEDNAPVIKFEDTDSETLLAGQVQWFNSTGVKHAFVGYQAQSALDIGTVTSNAFNIRTGGIARMQVEADGDVKIGGVSASATEGLTVYDDIKVYRDTNLNCYLSSFTDTSSYRPKIQFQRARGTSSSPSAVQVGDLIGDFQYQPYINGGYQNPAGGIYGIVSEIDGSDCNMTIQICTTEGNGNYAMKLDHEHKVSVDKVLRLEPISAPDWTEQAGDIYFDSDDNTLKCYNGTSWNDLF